ncbi:MAG: hypothetical protein ACOYNP_19495 [Gemmataceae bacterium]
MLVVDGCENRSKVCAIVQQTISGILNHALTLRWMIENPLTTFREITQIPVDGNVADPVFKDIRLRPQMGHVRFQQDGTAGNGLKVSEANFSPAKGAEHSSTVQQLSKVSTTLESTVYA